MKATQWKRISLGDICKFKYGQMPKKTDLSDEGYPVFSGYGVVGYATSYHYEHPEVIVVARGVGGTGDVKFSPPKCFLTNLSIAAQIASPNVDKHFLFYRLNYPSLWELRTGSAQAQITIERLNRHEVDIPSFPTQRKIASILSAYDDLIENNTRRIAILESMAQAIYREWFVEFRFPGHEKVKLVNSPLGIIPDGWRKQLGDVVTLKRGYDLPQRERTAGDVPLVSSSGITDFHNEAMAKGPGVVTGRYGTLGEVFYIQEDYWPLNTTLYVRDFHGNEPLLVLRLLRSLNLASQNAAGAVPGVNRNALHMLAVSFPPSNLQKQIAPTFETIEHACRNLRSKNANLRTTRDLLLPKLISGQLDVENLDIETGEAVTE